MEIIILSWTIFSASQKLRPTYRSELLTNSEVQLDVSMDHFVGIHEKIFLGRDKV